MSQLPPDSSDSPSEPNEGIKQQADNTSMGNGMQAIQGDGNVQVQGDNNSVFNYFQNLFLGKQELHLSRPRNEQLLLTKVKHEVASRLKQSLHDAVLINLGKEEQPEQVSPPLEAEIKIGSKPGRDLSDEIAILQVFDREDVAGRLLILGQPGSGKTTTLLELARSLANRAGQDFEYPIPVLFNLSSWRDIRKTLVDWLIEELESKYGVPKKTSKLWVMEKQLLPLLDGLDEVQPELQEYCVEAINQWLYGLEQPLYMVVSTRLDEYRSYGERLTLNAAINLHPLETKQVQEYLSSIEKHKLWEIIRDNFVLLELAKIPLFLSLMSLSFSEDKSNENFFVVDNELAERFIDAYIDCFRAYTALNKFVEMKIHPPKSGQRRSEVEKILEAKNEEKLALRVKYLMNSSYLSSFFDFYIQQMSKRSLKKDFYNYGEISIERKLFWLMFLAKHMNKNFSDEFSIDDTRYDSLEDSVYENKYRTFLSLILSAVTGFYFEIVTSLLYSPAIGLTVGISTTTLLFLILLRYSELVEKVSKYSEAIYASLPFYKELTASKQAEKSFMRFFNLLCIGVFLGIFSGLFVSMVDFLNNVSIYFNSRRILELSLSVAFSYSHGFKWGAIAGALSALGNHYISEKAVWNPRVRAALFSTLIFPISFVSNAFIDYNLPSSINKYGITYLSASPQNNEIIVIMAIGLLGGLMYGGIFYIKYHLSRFLLFKQECIPWNYAKFLDYCVEISILQKVGGRYKFIHKLLQDHFANMELK